MIPLPEVCDLSQLAASLRSGLFPLRDYLARIEALFEASEGELRAFTPEDRRFVRLQAETEQLLVRHPDPAARPPLFGIPIAVKDIVHVAGMPTRAGSALPADVLVGPESPCVAALKRAGALVLGKTETAEFAFRAPAATRNPYHPEHTPGGSSSGSAAAVSAGLVPFAIGSQTIGSTNRPAAYCGIAGFKPSYGRLPLSGVVPLAPSLDHLGLLAPTVADVAFAFGVLTGKPGAVPMNRPPVLGIPDGPYLARMEPRMAAHFEAVAARFRASGITVIAYPAFGDMEQIISATRELLAGEAAAIHQRWYAQFGELYRQQTADLITAGRAVAPAHLQSGRALRLSLRTQCLAARERHGFDCWLTPAATGPAPLGLGDTGDGVMQLPWSLSGLPTVNFRSGFIDGLPVGVQLVGGWYGDEEVLGTAAALEQIVADD